MMPGIAGAQDMDAPPLPPATFRAEHDGISVYNGNFGDDDPFLPPEITTYRSSQLSAVDGSWIIETFPWEHYIPLERGAFLLERIDPDTNGFEGGTGIRGQNYDFAHASINTATTTSTVAFSIPYLGSSGLESGQYAIYPVELPQTKVVYDGPAANESVFTDEDLEKIIEEDPWYSNNVRADITYGFSAIFNYVNDGPPPCTQDCFSNVLFLPGIKASRLYKSRPPGCVTDCEDQLWEPNANSDVEDLFLNSDGTSIRDDIYTRDIMDEHTSTGNGDVYGTFAAFMGNEVSAGVIKDWVAIPYDWRLDLEYVVENGTSLDGNLSYIGAAASSYAVNQVLRLAESSKSGKVTIVAHSNGGLFAKLLVNKLKEMGKENLIDKIVFVAVPQTGTPKAIGTLLHGYEEAILSGIITKASTARILAGNTPEAYNLLPSEEYFNGVVTPPVLFPFETATAQNLRAAYGVSIGSYEALHRFLLGLEGRPKPSADETNLPDVLNYDLLTRAEALHAKLDVWTPPDGVALYEVAGVGLLTPSGIKYVDDCPIFCPMRSPYLDFEPENVIEGDGTVVDASALAGTGTNYYFNVDRYNATNGSLPSVQHASLMGASDITSFIAQIIKKEIGDSLPSTITTTKPYFANAKHLIYRVHSPVSLDLYDSLGNHTGVATTTLSDGTVVSYVENNIPGSYYDEFGEVKYIFSDGSEQVNIVLNGLGSGVATFDINEMTGNTFVASTTFVNIAVIPQTRITMGIQAGGTISGASALQVDEDGDGTVDSELPAGGTVMYDDFVKDDTEEVLETVVTAPAQPAPSGGGNGPIVVAPSFTPSISVATTTVLPEIATSTPMQIVAAASTTSVATTTVTQEFQAGTSSVKIARTIVAPKVTQKRNSATSTNNVRLVAGAAASLPAPINPQGGERWWSNIYKMARNIIRLIIGL
ncbi:MAG: hypothetical protein Q7S01_05290 [bacterium]|nr:hypothetical protein [bacterium]